MKLLLYLCAAFVAAGNEEVGWMMPKEFDLGPGGAQVAVEPPLSAPAAVEAVAHGAHEAKAHESALEEAEKEHEEEEHEEEPDAVTWTTALLLIGFLIIGVGMLYLVNCADEDIREAIWGMINTTVSIFCAATFDNAFFRFCHFQLILSPPPRGLGLKHDTAEIKSFVGIGFSLLVWITVHAVLVMVPQDKHRLLFSIRTIGGHIYAFASIITFGFLQESAAFRDELWKVVAVVGIAFGVMVVGYKVAFGVAKTFYTEQKWKEMKVQRAQMREMQMDASAITVAFLLVQAFCYAMSTEDEDNRKKFIPILHGAPSEFIEHCTLILVASAAGLLVFSAVWGIYIRPAFKRARKCFDSTYFDYIGVLASVTGCWCLQRAGLIFLYHRFRGPQDMDGVHEAIPGEHGIGNGMATNRANIVNAFVMSLLSVACVLVIDKLADAAQKKEDATRVRPLANVERVSPRSPRDQALSFGGVSFDNLPDLPVDISATLTEFVGDEELSRLGASLRTVMTGFGMLVGICWDKAFETAHETVAETVPTFRMHPVIGTGLVAAILLFFVLPAWYWYIVPNAMKSEKEHKKDIEHQAFLTATAKGLELEVESSEPEPSSSSE